MSVTVTQYPNNTASVHHPMWIVATSTQATVPGFRFVFDIYFNAVLIYRAKVVPHPTDGKGYFDVSAVIRSLFINYFTPPFPIVDMPAWSTSLHFNYYDIQVGEQAPSLNGGVPYNFAGPSGLKIYNAYRELLPTVSSSNSVGGGYTYAPFTDRPLTIRMPVTGSIIFPFQNSLSAGMGIQFSAWFVGQHLPETDLYTVSTYTYPDDLLLFVFNQLTIGTGCPSIWPSVNPPYRIDFRFAANAGSNISPWYTIDLVCDPYEAKALHFLNRLGGYDTFYFMGLSRQSIEVSRKIYSQSSESRLNGGMNSVNPVTHVFNATDTPYATDIDLGYKLQSDYLTEDEHEWLLQLLISPEVYLENRGYFYPVTITTSKWEQKRSRTDKMFQLELEIKVATNANAQFR